MLLPELLLDLLELFTSEPCILQVFALVCKDWATTCQRVLFRHLKLMKWDRLVGCQDALHSRLGGYVRSLTIRVDDSIEADSITQEDFAHTVLLCPGLHRLNVDLFVDKFDQSTLSLLRRGPTLSTLDIRSTRQGMTTYQLLHVFRSIQSLHITFHGRNMSPTSVQLLPLRSKLPQLRSFKMGTGGKDLLGQVLTASQGNLEVLELDVMPHEASFTSLMALHGPFLRSLQLPYPTDAHIPMLKCCKKLMEFECDRIPSIAVVRALPKSLEHLKISYNGLTVQLAMRCIATDILPSLRIISCYDCIVENNWPSLITLRNLCGQKAVELKCYRVMLEEWPSVPVSFFSPSSRCSSMH
jgi:hypothetical protein